MAEPLNKVVIENHLAKLFLQVAAEQEVCLKGTINFNCFQDDFQADDCIQSDYRKGF